MNRRIVTTAGAAVLGLSALAGCGSSAGGSSTDAAGPDGSCSPAHEGLTTVAEGVLTTATYNFPPFVKVEGTQVGGLEGEILTRVAEMECLTLAGTPLDTGSVIPATQSGRVDVASGNWWCTAERAEVMALSNAVYMDQFGVISADGASSFEELEGKALGSVDGYNWNEDLKALYGSDLKLYPNPTAMYNDLKSGRLDAAVDSSGSAAYVNEQQGSPWTIAVPEADERVRSSLEPPQVCFPMSADNEALVEAVNDNIEALREDGTLADLLEKHGLDASAAEVGDLRLIE
jgi:polar amino acid transport system substrate-binding protein